MCKNCGGEMRTRDYSGPDWAGSVLVCGRCGLVEGES